VGDLRGRDHLESALASGKGVLLVTVHLGNWELGATALARFGRRLLVLTRAEPGDRFTERRQAARAAQGIDTLVVGDSGFGVVEVMRRLGDGGLVAQLIDRPDPGTAVRTTFLGAAFDVSRAPAELARATGCVILPTTLVRIPGGYRAEVLPAIPYDRRNLGSAEARAAFAGEILRAFEPAVRQHPEQWFHFVPVWPVSDEPS
jgi:KDO2-lipid IV(A) lauroyltransferase